MYFDRNLFNFRCHFIVDLLTNKLNRLKDYFGYSRSERNGILILFILLILTILFNILLPYIIKPDTTDFREFKEMILAFENRQTEIEDSLNNLRSSRTTYAKQDGIKLTPFHFDPNNLPVEEWKKLGLKNWQIELIKKYESKGGKFYQPEDLAKMYSISEKEYKILEPYIKIKNKSEASKKEALNPFHFDPNNVSRNDLQKMNIRESLTNAIVNYREKGGNFYIKEDLKKIYTITDEEYTTLAPFIIFEKDSIRIKTKPYKFIDTLLVDINSADTLDLQQLKGIGPSFSRRIIKYRDLLGGYYDKKQLLEVYGMDKSRFDGIKDNIKISDSIIVKININQASIKEMIKHPYIEFYIAKSIITYRKKIGSYKNLEEIKNARLIYEELYQKIVPYLTTN